jgi:hypothetical protein
LQLARGEAHGQAQCHAEPALGFARSGLKRATGAFPGRPSPFIVRHVWIAVSLWVCWRPRLPVGAASQIIPGSNQIVSEPRRLSASL